MRPMTEAEIQREIRAHNAVYEMLCAEKERETSEMREALERHFACGGRVQEDVFGRPRVWRADGKVSWDQPPLAGDEAGWLRIFIPEVVTPAYLADHLVSRMGFGSKLTLLDAP